MEVALWNIQRLCDVGSTIQFIGGVNKILWLEFCGAAAAVTKCMMA
jgi:hypothetical protein